MSTEREMFEAFRSDDVAGVRALLDVNLAMANVRNEDGIADLTRAPGRLTQKQGG